MIIKVSDEQIDALLGSQFVLNLSPDLPLILILLVYTDFLPLEFGKIQIFFLKICQNTDFFHECERFFFIFYLVIQIFSRKY